LSEYIDNLNKAIAAMHKCRCSHFGSEKIKEERGGDLVWEGVVEIFQLEGHPKASVAFGWAFEDDKKDIQYIGVLNVPPVESARDAVKAAIASGNFPAYQ
jgi:hypothetical protein